MAGARMSFSARYDFFWRPPEYLSAPARISFGARQKIVKIDFAPCKDYLCSLQRLSLFPAKTILTTCKNLLRFLRAPFSLFSNNDTVC